jgi:hypothetical protein
MLAGGLYRHTSATTRFSANGAGRTTDLFRVIQDHLRIMTAHGGLFLDPA